MQSFYRWHWQPVHAGIGYPGLFNDEKDLFAKTPNDIIKVISVDETIPYLDRYPAGCKLLVRYQPMTENWEQRGIADENAARAMAQKHADSMVRISEWAEARGVSRTRLWFSGLNEQKFVEGGGKEPYALGTVYWCELMRINQPRGINSVIGEWSVGWPPDGGVKDSPPNFEPFRPAWNAMGANDRWSYHAYWGGFGVDYAFEWLAGRMLQRPAWMRGKKLWLTECGSDRAPGNSPTAGWLSYPESSVAQRADRYMAELAHFEQRIREADPDVEYAFIFTLDGNRDDWARFDIMNQDLMTRLIPYLQADHSFKKATWPTTGGTTLEQLLAAEFGSNFEDVRTTLPRSSTQTYDTRPESAIDKLVVHHSAGPVTTGWPAIASYHVNDANHKWPGIGYHIGIGQGGKVSYLSDIRLATYHCGTTATPEDDNYFALGVCVLGNYETDIPTSSVTEAITRVAKVVNAYMGRTLRVVGHKDIDPTTLCPGVNLYPFVQAMGTPVVVPDTGALLAAIRESAWNAAHVAWNPGAALYKYAKAHDLGRPVTNEFEAAGQVCQGYERAIVYCPKGDWGNVKQTIWL